MENIKAMLVALESELYNAKRPMTNPTAKIVDENRFLNIINGIKSALPTAIIEAEYIMADRDKIIGQANANAQEIIKNANQNAMARLNDSEIIRIAEGEANKIANEARQYAEYLKSQTAAELMRMLRYGETALGNVLSATLGYIDQVKQGKLDFTADEKK